MKALLHYFTRDQLNWLVIYRHEKNKPLFVELLELQLAKLQFYQAVETQFKKDRHRLATWWHQLARQ